MTPDRPALPFRDDTLLGVCEGLGEEFGVHANWLRVALGAGLLISPVAVIAGYLALGVALMVSRWLFPAVRDEAPAAPAAPAAAVNDPAEPSLPLAA